MAEFGVPPPFRRSLVAIAHLTGDEAARLIEAFRSADPFRPTRELRASAQGALPEREQAVSDSLIPALLSLIGQGSPMSLATGVSRSLDLDLTVEAREHLSDRLAQLLAAKSLVTTASALDLLTQHERNYQTARIISDVRPIFTDSVEAPPSGAVIVEMLQIRTWDRDGAAGSVYIAMDEADLTELREVVDRALKKTSTLRDSLSDQGVAYFELDKRDF